MICDNLTISKDGRHLLFAGQDLLNLPRNTVRPCIFWTRIKSEKNAENTNVHSKSISDRNQFLYMLPRLIHSKESTKSCQKKTWV